MHFSISFISLSVGLQWSFYVNLNGTRFSLKLEICRDRDRIFVDIKFDTEKSEQIHCFFRPLFIYIKFDTEKSEQIHCLFRLLFLNI